MNLIPNNDESAVVAAGEKTSDPAGQVGRYQLTIPRLWGLAAIISIFALVSQWKVAGIDFWWHVRVGQSIIEQRQIPVTDSFSFTQAGQPWVNQGWLMEVLFYLVLQAGDLPLIIFLHSVAITAAYATLFWVCRAAAQGNLRWAALATLAAAIASQNWNVRPQTISILLFALTLLLLERQAVRLANGRRGISTDPALWLMAPLFLLWANSHGGFVFGLLLLLVHLVAHLWSWRRYGQPFPAQLLVVSGLSVLAILLTPLGINMIEYVLGFMRHPATQLYNMEFMPVTLRSVDGALFLAFVGLFLILLWISGYRLTAREALRLMAFGVLALMARRNGIWFCFVAAPTLAASMQILFRSQGSTGRPWLNRTVAMFLLLVVFFHLPWLRSSFPIPLAGGTSYVSAETPVEAVTALCDMPNAKRVFNNQGYGSYMIWACPEKPVFIDSRFELYPLEQWEDYLAISEARYDWQQLIDVYQIDTLLLNRESQKHLANALTATPTWRQVYQDEHAVIFQRLAGPN